MLRSRRLDAGLLVHYPRPSPRLRGRYADPSGLGVVSAIPARQHHEPHVLTAHDAGPAALIVVLALQRGPRTSHRGCLTRR